MISITIYASPLPSLAELVVPPSLGEFRKGITRLAFAHTLDLSSVITSLVFSFPNLKELVIYKFHFGGEAPPHCSQHITETAGPARGMGDPGKDLQGP